MSVLTSSVIMVLALLAVAIVVRAVLREHVYFMHMRQTLRDIVEHARRSRGP